LPWAGPFALVLGILLARNAWLFAVPVYEDADMGAYSIQVEQARRFTLLAGNYSRERFDHPGPAFLYVQAGGEDLWYALLRVVPAAWNGEVLGLYLLSSFFAACVAVIGWPGNFGRYLAYTSAMQAGGHSVAQVADYVLWFWWPRAGAWGVAAGLTLLAAAWRMPRGAVRRFCLALLGGNALSTVAFAAYAATGVDAVTGPYTGYFYWSAPVLMLLVVFLAGTESLAKRWSAPRFAVGIAVALALAGCAAFAVAPLTRLTTDHADPGNPRATGPASDPSLPAGAARIGALAAGRYAVLSFPHAAWPAITGILVQAERSGVAACVADPWWEFMLTPQFICTRQEILAGARFTVWAPDTVPRGMPVLFRLRRGIVTYSPK